MRGHSVLEEGEEARSGTGWVALAVDVARRDIQGREQVRRPVPNVVVGTLLGGADGDRQQRLGAVQGLNLGLFVHAEHDRAPGWVQVQADDVGELVRELRIPAEGSLPLWCQSVGPPQHRHITGRHRHTFRARDERRHLSAGPM